MACSNLKKIIILILNIILYLIYGNYILPIILTSITAFYFGKIVGKSKNFYVVSIAYLLIILPLVFFKYLINIMDISILVPLGISYYTLSLISYISDIYHKKYQPSKNLIDFFLFSLYFPCLFIGPINKYGDFVEKINHIKINCGNLYDSLLRICIGLIKKLIVANKLSVIILTLSSDVSLSGWYVLLGCFVYSIFLYCDFSGGIDIVLGISKIFNLDLVENFDKPYLSQSIKEFWRRWHISLGTWLKDYVYIPMGGNREGTFNTKINILFTFFISGIWHGLHYILWGIINGILVIFNFKTKNKVLNIIITFILISSLWVFFIYNNTFLSLEMFISIFKGGSFNIGNLGLKLFDYIIILPFLGIAIVYELKINIINKYLNKTSFNMKLLILLGIILLVLLFGNYGLDVNSSNFVYGNF